MTERERWIVYPLLFMALGFGLKNGIEIQADHQGLRALQIDSIRCHELQVTNGNDVVVARLRASPSNGVGALNVANGKGDWQAELKGGSIGGTLSAIDSHGRPHMWPSPTANLLLPAKPATQEESSSADHQ